MTDKEILEVLKETRHTCDLFNTESDITDGLDSAIIALESREPPASVEQEAREWAESKGFVVQGGSFIVGPARYVVDAYLAGHASGAEKGRGCEP